jgi:hypothetical protein
MYIGPRGKVNLITAGGSVVLAGDEFDLVHVGPALAGYQEVSGFIVVGDTVEDQVVL